MSDINYSNELSADDIITEQSPTPLSGYTDLTPNEKAIIDYIIENPGVTKQGIVNAFYGRLSRATIFNAIGRLSDLEVIQIKKERPNSQIHQVFVNKESLIISTIRSLNRIETLFLYVLRKIRSLNIKQMSAGEREDLDILSFHLFSLYMEFVKVYMSKALITWPRKTLNRNLVNRLHLILFSKLINIQMTLSNSLPSSYFVFDYKENPNKYPFLHSVHAFLESSMRIGRKYGFSDELELIRNEISQSKDYHILPTEIESSETIDMLKKSSERYVAYYNPSKPTNEIKKYLKDLVNKEYLIYNSKTKIYDVTQKGEEYLRLNNFKSMEELVASRTKKKPT